MNLLVLTTSYPGCRGDYSGDFVHQPLRELVAGGGVRVSVLCPDDPRTAQGANLDGVDVRRARYFWPKRLQVIASSSGGGGVPAALKRSWLAWLNLPFLLASLTLHVALAARRADLVHAHWIPNGLLAALAKPFYRRPLVLTVHGSDWNMLAASRWGRLLIRWVVARVDAVAVVNQRFLDQMRLFCDMPPVAEHTPLGVDAQLFRPLSRAEACRRLNLEARSKRLLFVGSLTTNKRAADLLRAFGALAKQGRTVHLALVGEGPEMPNLRRLARRLGVGSDVLFAGKQPRQDVPLWMNASDVLVLPSYAEGSPSVIREAFACGLPVVASAVGGVPEMVRDGANGFLFAPGDLVALQQKLAALLEGPGRLGKLSAGALASFQSAGTSWRDHARQLADIYQQVMRPRLQ